MDIFRSFLYSPSANAVGPFQGTDAAGQPVYGIVDFFVVQDGPSHRVKFFLFELEKMGPWPVNAQCIGPDKETAGVPVWAMDMSDATGGFGSANDIRDLVTGVDYTGTDVQVINAGLDNLFSSYKGRLTQKWQARLQSTGTKTVPPFPTTQETPAINWLGKRLKAVVSAPVNGVFQ